jgi:hypothetical protein
MLSVHMQFTSRHPTNSDTVTGEGREAVGSPFETLGLGSREDFLESHVPVLITIVGQSLPVPFRNEQVQFANRL